MSRWVWCVGEVRSCRLHKFFFFLVVVVVVVVVVFVGLLVEIYQTPNKRESKQH